MTATPPGFEPFESSEFVRTAGPLWIRRGDGPPTLGAFVGEQHANTGGIANCFLLVDGRRAVRGSGIFTVLSTAGRADSA